MMEKIKTREVRPTAFQGEHSIEKIQILDLIPNVMDNVVIMERNGEHLLNIPANMDAMRWRNWIKSPGGVFSKDFLSWIREKSDPEYLLVKSETLKTVIRVIREDEIEKFNSLKLINGKLKDVYYMHLKTVGIDEELHGIQRRIEEPNIEEDESIILPKGNHTIDEDENDSQYHSEALFD